MDKLSRSKSELKRIEQLAYGFYGLMSEEIADTLLNKPKPEPNFTQYYYLFMPSRPNIERSQRLER
ncbi:MAG: hypothetical protein Q7R77_00735 [Candidatus Daviesbacteria bacterium]|nr:hypothetical protein [Candidatus Daviesbacteria bacterium]